MEVINIVPASVQCSCQSPPLNVPFVYFHPAPNSTPLGTCGLDSVEVPLLPPGPGLPSLGELRQPVFPAAAAHISESLAGVGCTQHSTTHSSSSCPSDPVCADKRVLYVTPDSTRKFSHSTAGELSIMTQCAQ